MKKTVNRANVLAFKALQRAVEQDKIRLYLDYGRINRPTSPVYNPWENLLPILVPVMIGLLLVLTVGIIFGLAFIISMILVYNYYFKKKQERKVIERTKAYLISDIEHCKEIWDFGGIVLVNADNKKIGCVSPDGDWKDFVVLHFSDLMVEKKEKQESTENEQNAA